MLFNTLLSLSSKWHSRGENAVRRSGIDYTILRPGGLSDEERPSNVRVQVARGPLPPPGRISRADVADLCVAALSSSSASNSTLACAWASAAQKKGQTASD